MEVHVNTWVDVDVKVIINVRTDVEEKKVGEE